MDPRPALALLLSAGLAVGTPVAASAQTPSATGQVVAQVVRDGEVSFEVLDVARYGSLAATRRAASRLPGVDIVTTPVTVRAFGTDGPERADQWHLDALLPDRVPAAATAARDVVVAVLDTGVDRQHPDFAPGTLLCDKGADFSDSYAPPGVSVGDGCSDVNGHGTHVAGIIAAARGNGTGVAGMTEAKILPVAVLDMFGAGTDWMIAAGIRHAVDQGADILSMSLGSSTSSPLIESAVDHAASKGVLMVAAAGNNRQQGNAQNYPASYPSVLSVAATSHSGTSTPFSQSGPAIDLAAPGVAMMSTFRRGRYGWLDGTSQAAPVVAATAAMYLAAHPAATPEQVRGALLRTARDVEAPGRDDQTGAGVVDPAMLLTGTSHVLRAPAAPVELTAALEGALVTVRFRGVPGTADAPVRGWVLSRDGQPVAMGHYDPQDTRVGYWDATAPGGRHTYRAVSLGPGGESAAVEVTLVAPRGPQAPPPTAAPPAAPTPAPAPTTPPPAPAPPAPAPDAPALPPVAPPTTTTPVPAPTAAAPTPRPAPVLRVPATGLPRGALVPVLGRGLEPRSQVRVTAGWTERVRRVVKGKPVVQAVSRTAVLAVLRVDRDGDLEASVRGPQVVGPVRVVLEGVKPGGVRARSQSTVTLR